MKNYSIWKDNVKMPSYKSLDKDLDIDVLIIGGGMTGVSTLYQLRNSSLSVFLVEQNKLGMGVTVNSTGKLNYMQDSLYDKIIKSSGESKAVDYLKSQKEAIKLAVDIIDKEKISCNLMSSSSFIYGNSESEVNKLKKLRDFLEKNDIKVIEGNNDLIDYKYMIGVEDTYVFHPLKFIKGMVSKLKQDCFYEGTSIRDIKRDNDIYICETDRGFEIKAKWVVIASHYPYFNFPFLFPIKGSLEKSYLSASKYKKDNISLIRYEKPMISMRSYLDYLLYLSNSHNASGDVNDKEHYLELEKKLNDLGLSPDYLWSNMDIMTNDGLPFVGEIKEHLLIGTGYNTWGMTNGILAGKILADIILGEVNPYVSLFEPKRVNGSMVSGAIMNGFYSIRGYCNGYLKDNDKVKYKFVNGKEIAIYKDELGEHKVYTKCPHMGCRLIFNDIEKTWDCPCHASRFDLDGRCISGPSNRDISVED